MLDAIVMDMDGTLLDPNNKILPETKAALIACQKQGTKLVLASGRSYTRLLSYAKELEMDVYGGYLLEVDGIAYYDVQKDERYTLCNSNPAVLIEKTYHYCSTPAFPAAIFSFSLFQSFSAVGVQFSA